MNLNQKRAKKNKRTNNSNVVHDRTTIQLQSGPTKAYTKRNPYSQQLRPLPTNSQVPPTSSKRGRSGKPQVSESLLADTALQFQHSILLEEYDNPGGRPNPLVSQSLNPTATPRGAGFRHAASEGNYGNLQMIPRPITAMGKNRRMMGGKPRCQR